MRPSRRKSKVARRVEQGLGQGEADAHARDVPQRRVSRCQPIAAGEEHDGRGSVAQASVQDTKPLGEGGWAAASVAGALDQGADDDGVEPFGEDQQAQDIEGLARALGDREEQVAQVHPDPRHLLVMEPLVGVHHRREAPGALCIRQEMEAHRRFARGRRAAQLADLPPRQAANAQRMVEAEVGAVLCRPS